MWHLYFVSYVLMIFSFVCAPFHSDLLLLIQTLKAQNKDKAALDFIVRHWRFQFLSLKNKLSDGIMNYN